jgi:excinuclease ABC subunit A
MKEITIKGARVHNLKNIDITIPRDQLVVITGLSGSGKSSLAFDTIYAEGQRRYVESLSAYARQFLGMMDKPDVDKIEGLSPAISIDQKSVSKNPRSTVGTVTEIYDYFRLLYARVGVPYHPDTGEPMRMQDAKQIVDEVMKYDLTEAGLMILAPLVMDKKGEHKGVLDKALKDGFMRLRVDGIVYLTEEASSLNLDKNKKHNIELVIDRLLDSATFDRVRVLDSVETALRFGGGQIIVSKILDRLRNRYEDRLMSERYVMPETGISFGELEPKNFSFNSPHGACPHCDGLGYVSVVSPDLIIPNPKLSIKQGAIKPWTSFSRQKSIGGWYMKILLAAAEAKGYDLGKPVKDLTPEELNFVLYGDDTKVKIDAGGHTMNTQHEGVVPNLERRYKETDSDFVRTEIEKYMVSTTCPECGGKRLRREFLWVKVAGKSIDEMVSMPINELHDYLVKVEGKNTYFDEKGLTVSKPILKEIIARLDFLLSVGLDYLTLDRASNTLSGGEAQRIRLATQIGSGLVGVLYILDEPSIGLHQRDNHRLIETLTRLRDIGNSVIVVEHDEDTIRTADFVIDIGPGAGHHGGEIIAAGTPEEVTKSKGSTGLYLSGKKSIKAPKEYRKGNGQCITVKGAAENNLKNINVKFPLGKFICVTGVSGSGKSTLVEDILSKAISHKLYRSRELPGKHKDITGIDQIDKMVNIDQAPIGRTPRSNAATYTGLFTYVRDLFSKTQEAQVRGYGPGRFSFNVKGGRCETCKGEGVLKIEMNFLPDIYVPCEACHGKRYNKEVLDIKYKGQSISDVLDMDVETALSFFSNIPPLKAKLQTLYDVGLSYLKLGQPATELSGGEAQRIKLASELSKRSTGRTLYVLDEPTTGLHFEDVDKLLKVLHALADKGNTILVIEHNLDVIKSADHLIDIGPEGGVKGGQVVAEGTPKQVAKVKESYTGQFLSKMKI